MTQRIYKVYVLKDLSGDIIYAGLTKQTLQKRFNGHVCRLKINRYQATIELIQDDLTKEQAVVLEKMLIKQYNLLEDGYNKSPGSINGNSNSHSEEQKKKWSEERKGKKVSPEHAAKNKTARLGQTNSEVHNRKIGNANARKVICIENGIVYPSTKAAAKHLKVHASKVSLVCLGKRISTGGYHFKYVETVDPSRND